MKRVLVLFFAFCAGIRPLAAGQDGRVEFPPATPESQGLMSADLDSLFSRITGYFNRDEIVGAEFLVIKNRKTVFHRTVGWRDREAGLAWEPNTACNVRSMTKPLTGTAIAILISRGKLKADDPVAGFVKGFRNEKSKSITVGQLLTHRSGLPLSFLLTQADLERYPSLQALADSTGRKGPDFPPGSRFWYSDAGVEVLGAVVEILTGKPLEVCFFETVLKPLGMEDSFFLSRINPVPKTKNGQPLFRRHPGNGKGSGRRATNRCISTRSDPRVSMPRPWTMRVS